MSKTRAKFSNAARERVLYVSWINDDVGIAQTCVGAFIEELEIIHADESGIPLRTECTQVGSVSLSGNLKTKVMRREFRNRVTDFIGVLTTAYIKHNKRGEADAELVIFLKRKLADDDGSLTMWLAPLEAMQLRWYVIANIRLGDPTWWHRLKGDNEGWKFPTKDDLKAIGEFHEEIRQAVYRILQHTRCEACGPAPGELVSQPVAPTLYSHA